MPFFVCNMIWSWDSSVDIVTGLRDGRPEVRIPTGAREFSPKRPHLLLGRPVMRLTTHLHLMLRLRFSGAIPPLPSVCVGGVSGDNFTSVP